MNSPASGPDTTARDVAAASGVSLAAIGYHYGSKETLLNAAMMQATEEWGEELERALATETAPDATPMERFEAAWARVVESGRAPATMGRSVRDLRADRPRAGHT